MDFFSEVREKGVKGEVPPRARRSGVFPAESRAKIASGLSSTIILTQTDTVLQLTGRYFAPSRSPIDTTP